MFKSDSQKLTDNIGAATGLSKPEGYASHHIVPVRAGNDLKEVRNKLERYGLDINDAVNGVYLPDVAGINSDAAYHRSLHNKYYFGQLQRDFQNVRSKDDAIDVLDRIRDRLLSGTYPGSKPVPPRKP